MEKNILISFLVPCYNSEAYMNICLDSLLKADHNLIEIIIVDDGSKDKTSEIADKYQSENPDCINVIHKENGGHGDAINDGIKVAKGKYFKIVDSDDWVDLDALNKILKSIQEEKELPDLYILNYVYYVGYGNKQKVINYKSIFEENKILTCKDFHFKDIQKNITLHSAMFKLDVIKESNVVLPKHASYEDNYFVYACLVHTKTFMYINGDFYCYLIGRDGQSVSYANCVKKYKDHILCSKSMNDYFDPMNIKKTNKDFYKLLFHHIRLIFCITVLYTRLSKEKESRTNYKLFLKDLKEKHPKLYKKLRYFSISSFLCMPGAFGRGFNRFILWLAKKVVPFDV